MEQDLFNRKLEVANRYKVKPHTISALDKHFQGVIAGYKIILETMGFNTEGMSFREINTIVEDIITEIHG